jgi:hypothetical protein
MRTSIRITEEEYNKLSQKQNEGYNLSKIIVRKMQAIIADPLKYRDLLFEAKKDYAKIPKTKLLCLTLPYTSEKFFYIQHQMNNIKTSGLVRAAIMEIFGWKPTPKSLQQKRSNAKKTKK